MHGGEIAPMDLRAASCSFGLSNHIDSRHCMTAPASLSTNSKRLVLLVSSELASGADWGFGDSLGSMVLLRLSPIHLDAHEIERTVWSASFSSAGG